jgi:23S rRNA (uracil1939-C5)-methyltransferase
MQHIAYEHQLELKQRQVGETFIRVGRFPHPPVAPALPSPRPYAYRGKAEFHLAGGRDAPWRAGLMALASHEIVEIERCAIADETINAKYGAFRESLQRGAATVRQDRLTIWSDEAGEPPIAVATGPGMPPDVTRFVLGKRIIVPYGGFFQANIALTGELVRAVERMAALTGNETVVDAYAGSGLFSLFLGPLAGRLYGIEGDREAARCAQINLSREGLDRAAFFQGDVGEMIGKELLPKGLKADVVVLDPPRDGCREEVLAGIVALRPARIVYVSCNPATQARDCRRLADSGYVLRTLQPFDMFPQTAHIEVAALLTPAAEKDKAA